MCLTGMRTFESASRFFMNSSCLRRNHHESRIRIGEKKIFHELTSCLRKESNVFVLRRPK